MPASELDAIRARRDALVFLAPSGNLILNEITLNGRDDLDALAKLVGSDVPALLAEVDRLRCTDPIECGHEAALGQALAEIEQRVPTGDVDLFLRRERDEYEPRGECWNTVDDVLDAFRLHVVTGTPLTEPRPHGGPEAPGVGPEPLTEAEELRAEVERLTAELVESRRGEHCALTDYALARARADKAETERDKLRVELDTAKAVMSKALKEVEHEEVVFLLHRYLTALPTTTGEGER